MYCSGTQLEIKPRYVWLQNQGSFPGVKLPQNYQSEEPNRGRNLVSISPFVIFKLAITDLPKELITNEPPELEWLWESSFKKILSLGDSSAHSVPATEHFHVPCGGSDLSSSSLLTERFFHRETSVRGPPFLVKPSSISQGELQIPTAVLH